MGRLTAPRHVVISLIALWLLQGGCSKPVATEGTVRMATDSYFNRITQQLIDPPASSDAVLERALRDGLPSDQFSAADAVVQARGWVEEMLREEFRPGGQSPFVPFPLENGVCDIVRARYRAGSILVDVAQSRHLLSVRISSQDLSQGNPVTAVLERAAVRLFSLPGVERIETATGTGAQIMGRVVVPKQTGADPEWPDWRQSLRWWAATGELGFVAIKLPGGPTRENITDEEEANVHWFK
jgi:hypothetical protein